MRFSPVSTESTYGKAKNLFIFGILVFIGLIIFFVATNFFSDNINDSSEFEPDSEMFAFPSREVSDNQNAYVFLREIDGFQVENDFEILRDFYSATPTADIVDIKKLVEDSQNSINQFLNITNYSEFLCGKSLYPEIDWETGAVNPSWGCGLNMVRDLGQYSNARAYVHAIDGGDPLPYLLASIHTAHLLMTQESNPKIDYLVGFFVYQNSLDIIQRMRSENLLTEQQVNELRSYLQDTYALPSYVPENVIRHDYTHLLLTFDDSVAYIGQPEPEMYNQRETLQNITNIYRMLYDTLSFPCSERERQVIQVVDPFFEEWQTKVFDQNGELLPAHSNSAGDVLVLSIINGLYNVYDQDCMIQAQVSAF